MTIDSQQAALHLFFGVQISGTFPSDESPPGVMTLGMVRMAASSLVTTQVTPQIASAGGQILNINTNTALFSLIGTEYGGDGSTTLALPDLRGRAALGGEWGDSGADDVGDTIIGPAEIGIMQTHLPIIAGGTAPAQPNAQPSQTLHYLIRTGEGSGTAQVAGGIVAFAAEDGVTLPAGYLVANGSLLQIDDYPDLFAALGTTYGGDGETTFGLPDLTGRTVTGASATTPLGSTFGSEAVTITLDNLPEEMGGGGVAIDNRGPGIALHYIINVSGGTWPSTTIDADDAMLGEIMLYAGDPAELPAGWIVADGTLLPIAGNGALFAIMGTTFGGDGASTFAVPDLRDRVAQGTPNGGFIGTNLGSNFTTLAISDIPALDIEGTEDADTYIGGGLGDNIRGNGGADSLTGNGGADTISGGEGADTIHGGAGADSLSGGTEADTFLFASNDEMSGDTIDGGLGFDIIRLTSAGTYDFATAASISSIEFLTLADDSGGWSVTLRDANLQVNSATTLTHGVTLDASALTGSNKVEVNGSNFDGDDSLLGSDVSDIFSLLGEGDDTIDGAGGTLDWVVIESTWLESSITEADGDYTIVTPLGTKLLRNVEFLQFGGVSGPGQLLTTSLINLAPTADVDLAEAVEAGLNGDGSSATGNVLDNDSDPNASLVTLGETKTVSAIALGEGSLVAVDEDPVSVEGLYGTLQISADGSYTYVVDDANPLVDILRTGETLEEIFTYEVRDAKGLTSSSTLTVTIQGDIDYLRTVIDEDTSHVFSIADFPVTDPYTDEIVVLADITILTLPTAGLLIHNGTTLTSEDLGDGYVVSASDIADGKLVFAPVSNAHGYGYADFTFKANAGDGPLAAWTLEQNGNDVSGNGHTLVLAGVTDTEGHTGRGVEFDGSQDDRLLSAGGLDSNFNSGPFSVQLWVKFDSFTHEVTLIEDFTDAGGPGWTLTLTSPTSLQFFTPTTGPINRPVSTFSTGEWHQIVVTRDDVGFNLYFDGAKLGSTFAYIGSFTPSANNLLIGGRNDGDERNFTLDGAMDDISLWTRTLSASEIAGQWANGTGIVLPPTHTMHIDVVSVPDAPLITTNSGAPLQITIAENSTGPVTTIAATDGDLDAIIFSLAGADAALFDINATTGVLAFKAPPDFETRADHNADNDYEFIVTASDGVLEDTQAVTVRVGNVKGNTINGTSKSNKIDETNKIGGKGATSEEDKIDGKAGNDSIKGAGGNDSLIGGSGNDTLNGGTGNDLLTGGTGKDKLTGGTGADGFVFNATLGSSNIDTITDFQPDFDKIRLDDAIFKKIGSSLTKSEFYAKSGATSAHDKSDHIIYDTKTGRLYYDSDGKGGAKAVHFATLSNKPAIDHLDFMIV